MNRKVEAATEPAIALLGELELLDIRLRVEDGRLRFSAPKGVLTDALRARIADLRAELIATVQHRDAVGDGPEASIPVQPRDRGLPLSSAQQRFWFLDRLDSGNSAAFVMPPMVMTLSGPLDAGALHAALRALVVRHEVLRTAFRIESDQPVQVPMGEVDVPMPLEDLSGLDATAREARLTEARQREAHTPFDLTRGEALLRARLLRTAAREHVFVLTMHHIIADGWSMGILVDELARLYRARLLGAADGLAPLPIQYADYAAWERGRLSGARFERLIRHWRGVLDDAPDFLELPTDRPRPRVRSNRGDAVHFSFDAGLSRHFLALCTTSGVTPFMALLTAYALLLQRYTGRDDLVIGTPISVRPHAQVEPLIGLFLNTLALRLDLSGDPDGTALLQRVRQRALDAFEHADLPFESLLQSLGVERSLDRTPLFQVLFAMQNAPLGEIALEGLRITPSQSESVHSPFDLVLSMEEGATGLTGFLRYSTDLFDRATIARMVGHFRRLVEGLVEAPQASVARLPMLAEDELEKLRRWRGEGARFPVSDTLVDRFRTAAARTPAAMALRCDALRLDYRALDALSDRVAFRLARLGVSRGDRVGLCVDRTERMVIALLGILKAGAAYVPLDPAYPDDRLAFMAQDAGLDVLVVDQAARSEIAPSARRLALDDPTLADQAAEPLPAGSPDDVAYVIYTSGSTGRPKGVEVTHANVLRLFDASRDLFGFGPGDVWSLFHSYAFDFSVWELWGALLHGGEVVVVPYAVSRSPERFLELLASAGVTMLSQTPSAFRQLIEADTRAPKHLPLALKWVVFGGEALDARALTRWVERRGLDAPQLINMYGITETTVHVSFHRVGQADLDSGASVIGRALPDLTVDLVDTSGRLVPVGVPGELLVGGEGVALGYLNRAELTAQRFVQRDGARVYRSGDLARWRADGVLEYLGRMDNQVKVRGFRIELGEIEAALASHPEVAEAVVEVRDDGFGPRLLGWVASSQFSDAQLSARLREHLRARLPDYMIPAAIATFERLPLTGNGKLDRKALLAPSASVDGAGTQAPRDALEQMLAQCWREVLGVDAPGIDDNFFEQGGDSIRGAILVNKIQDRLRSVLYVVALFEAPTIRALADYLRVHYPETIAAVAGEVNSPAGSDALPPIVESDLDALQALVPPMPPFAGRVRKRNPRAVFVLSPPRSGSTLLRVLLGGHPALFSPPELELLGFETLGQRRLALAGADAMWLEGTLRAVMELHGLDAEGARRWMAEREDRDLPVADLYAEVQRALCVDGRTRMLVDKSPSYALDVGVLRRAEACFDEPLYLHLHRHPGGMIASFDEARLDRIFFRYPHAHSPRRLAELIWARSHENIATFLEGIPAERQTTVGFEEMTHDPVGTAQRLCRFLGIDFDPAMLDIHGAGRMTDGLHAESRMLGDIKFHTHSGIDAATAERWREVLDEATLGAPTWRVAARFGYQRVAPAPTQALSWIKRRTVDDIAPPSYAQQRLWFLDQLEGAGIAYNMPVALRLRGPLDADALDAALRRIVERHRGLSSRFETVDGTPTVRLDATRAPLVMDDLGALEAGARAATLARMIEEHARAPFDLARGPLFRARLVRLQHEEAVLLLNMHHIVSDGWSMGVLARELGVLYSAFSCGQPDPLAPLPVQYPDYAAWQREHLSAESLASQITRWRERLAGAPALLELPADRPRPPIQRFAGEVLATRIDTELSRALRQLAERSGASMYMVLIGAFATLLSRLSGQQDLVIGSPSANRTRSELEPLIGFFVNTLAIRLDADPSLGFSEFLAQVRVRALEAFAIQDVPFEQLVEELRPQRNLGYSPICQVMFSMQNTPATTPTLRGLTVEEIPVGQGVSKLDLTLSVTERDGGLDAVFEFSTDLFDRQTIERLAGHYETLLRGIVASPGLPLARLPLLTPGEQARIVTDWNRTQTVWPIEPATIHGRFAAQVARTPDAPAVVCGSERVSYAELDALSERIAARLRESGLGAGPLAGALVGIFAPRSVRMLAGMLAILKTGCAYLPIDPTYPADRIRDVLEDSGASLLLTESALLGSLPQAGCPLLCLDEPDAHAPAARPGRTLPADLAYVIYTSGSTGRPKGVMIGHGAAVNFLRSMAVTPGIGPGDRVLALTTISFDIAVLELWLPLANGARVVLVDENTTRDGAALAALMRTQRVTIAQATPATWRMLLDAGWQGDDALTVLCGGEAMPSDLARRLLPCCARLWNMYGPTETTVWSCIEQVDEAALARVSVPVGRPIANTVVRILDPVGMPQPPGVAGELLIGGDGLAFGYLGRPDLTAERFIDDPLTPGARLYRTGDLARYLPDGRIEFLGRGDQQVKVRGFRVELGEVEHVLGRLPGIAECAVVLDAGAQAGDAHLVAFYTGDRSAAEAPAMRRAMLAALPDYMVPGVFVRLERLPLTPNGKVDRRALKVEDARHAHAASGGFRDKVEQALVAIWEEVLGVRPIGIRDDFFALGGHSVIAVRLMAQIAREFDVRLPLAALFQGPAIESLARLLRDGSPARAWSSLVPIHIGGSAAPLFCAAGAGGNVVYFHDLARALGERSFLGLQPPGLDGSTAPLDSVEALASHYLDAIRAGTGESPRLVGGHSFGGLVAYEMARRLADEGHAPELLVLIDTPGPAFFEPTGLDWSEAHWLAQVAAIVGHLYGASLDLDLQTLEGLSGQEQLALLNTRMIDAGVLPEGSTVDYLRGFVAVYKANLRVRYRPEPLPAGVRVLLLRSAQAQPDGLASARFAQMRREPDLGWQGLLPPDLRIAEVPGDHLTMMRAPNAATIAQAIRDAIEGEMNTAAGESAGQSMTGSPGPGTRGGA